MKKLNLYHSDNKIFFTSDLHFGHKDILKFCNRPFTDVREMNESLIENWNVTISDEDVIFVLGDTFWFNDRRVMKKYLNRLNGKDIYIMLGNHCDRDVYDSLVRKNYLKPNIHVIDDIAHINIYNNIGDEEYGDDRLVVEVVASHYPLLTWSHRNKNSINVFGHIHSGPVSTCTIDLDLPYFKTQHYDVGVDNNNYKPIEIQEILDKLKKEP